MEMIWLIKKDDTVSISIQHTITSHLFEIFLEWRRVSWPQWSIVSDVKLKTIKHNTDNGSDFNNWLLYVDKEPLFEKLRDEEGLIVCNLFFGVRLQQWGIDKISFNPKLTYSWSHNH